MRDCGHDFGVIRPPVWPLARNRLLSGKRPIDLIAAGELDRVRGAAEILELGGGV